MERFHPNFNYCDEMAPDPSGNWVSYEDAQARVAELEAKVDLEYGLLQDAKKERDRYRETIQSFLSTVLTVKRENQPEWMEYLAERINEVCEVIGEDDRVAYNPRQEAILPIK